MACDAPPSSITRRRLMALLGGGLIASGFAGKANAQVQPSKPRIVVLDWALAATALALRANVVGVPAIDYYRQSVIEPPMPDEVTDVGLLFTPNFELLDQLAPDLIIIPPSLRVGEPFLKRIAPTLIVDLSHNGDATIASAITGSEALAKALDAQAEWLALRSRMEQQLQEATTQLSSWHERPLWITTSADDRHLTAFGPGSLFADILTKLGLINAQKDGGFWRGQATVGLDRIASVPEAGLVLIAADGSNSASMPSMDGVFWQALPAVRDNRLFQLPPIMDNGGVPAIIRFARLLAVSLNGKGA